MRCAFLVLLLLSRPGLQGQAFDGARALGHVRRIVACGPRTPGSVGSAACRAYLRAEVQAMGLQAEEQRFRARTPLGALEMVNLVVRLPGERKETLLLGGHYDTKRMAFPYLGANDGGSNAGFLLELLWALKDRPRRMTLEVVFFDGEEAIREWKGQDHTYGSRAYVAAARREGKLCDLRAMLHVDMVGDATLGFPRIRGTSRALTDLVWASARRQGCGACFLDAARTAEDDHTPFAQAGVPTVDLIDWDYAPWHTPEDTVDRLSAASLQRVGEVLLDALPRLEARLLR